LDVQREPLEVVMKATKKERYWVVQLVSFVAVKMVV
jgi:hypothetical protein